MQGKRQQQTDDVAINENSQKRIKPCLVPSKDSSRRSGEKQDQKTIRGNENCVNNLMPRSPTNSASKLA